MKPKVGVLLSGCGVYDGAEIHESVLTLLALSQQGAEAICIAPDVPQHHVVNHLTGEPMSETRNVLTEAARIARGSIIPLAQVSASELDALIMPGGFGVAKNFTKWAFEGPDGAIDEQVKALIVQMVKEAKPMAAICMSPTVVAKALEGSGISVRLTVGSTEELSPYDIRAISGGMQKVGAKPENCTVTDVVVDDAYNLITSPCYMMEASIAQVYEGIYKTVAKLVELTSLQIQS